MLAIRMTDINFDEGEEGIFQNWKVRKGATIRTAAFLLIYTTNDGIQKQMKSICAGVVDSLANLKTGDTLNPGQFIMRLKPCDHSVVMKDLCADCGADLRRKHGLPGERAVQTHARVAMIHHIPELQITPEEARSYGTADEQNLLKQRKLVLLVDLDQTLIHTTNEDVNPNLKDVHHFQLYGMSSPWYHTRLRPHARHFLDAMSRLYELHICTFGARMYAHVVAKILDPDGKLFGHRILSREECFDPNLKTANLKALFPCGDRLVCIIDDREDVWNYAPNVVHVKPYRYFKHTGDINAPPGFSKNGQSKDQTNPESKVDADNKRMEKNELAESIKSDSTQLNETNDIESIEKNSNDESMNPTTSGDTAVSTEQQDQDEDDYLYHLEDILTRIHTAFYQMHDQMPADERPPDLKCVMPYVKNKVLQKCNIVFSGVVATNVAIETSSIYKAAVAFGANVQKEIILPHHRGKYEKSTLTTHLVAAKWGTAKVYQARKAGSAIKIVTPQWLWCCVERWEREDERLFLLSKDTVTYESKRQHRRYYSAKPDEILNPDGPETGSGTVSIQASTIMEDQEGLGLDDDMDLNDEPALKIMKTGDMDSVILSSSSTPTDSSSETENDDLAEALEKELE